jgi:hypothetical protein
MRYWLVVKDKLVKDINGIFIGFSSLESARHYVINYMAQNEVEIVHINSLWK